MKITPDLIDDTFEFSIPNYNSHNPRKDLKSHNWFRMDRHWYLDEAFQGLRAGCLGAWPVLLAVYTGKPRDSKRTNLTYLAKALGVKKAIVAKYITEFHNRGLIVVHVTRTLRDVPIQTDKQTNEDMFSKKREWEDAANAAPRPKGPSPSDLVEVWNQNRGPLPEVTKLAKTRYAKAKVRLNEEPDLGYWERVVKTIAETPFLRGENDRGWKADFDWLIANDANHVKVSEGKYGGSSQVITAESELARLEARFQAAREERI